MIKVKWFQYEKEKTAGAFELSMVRIHVKKLFRASGGSYDVCACACMCRCNVHDLSLPWLTGERRTGVCEQLLRKPRLPGPRRGSPAERGTVLAGSSALPRTVSESSPKHFHYIGVFQCPRP